MSIIEATEKDIPIIQKIAYETWPVTFENILSKEQIDYMLEMMYSIDSMKNQLLNQHKYLLFEDDEIGHIGYTSYQINNAPGVTRIHKIYVLPGVQGKGVGKKLIEAVEAKARLERNNSLILNVNRNNQAIKFYQHVGFRINSSENIDIGNGFLLEDYSMIKNIK